MLSKELAIDMVTEERREKLREYEEKKREITRKLLENVTRF